MQNAALAAAADGTTTASLLADEEPPVPCALSIGSVRQALSSLSKEEVEAGGDGLIMVRVFLLQVGWVEARRVRHS